MYSNIVNAAQLVPLTALPLQCHYTKIKDDKIRGSLPFHLFLQPRLKERVILVMDITSDFDVTNYSVKAVSHHTFLPHLQRKFVCRKRNTANS